VTSTSWKSLGTCVLLVHAAVTLMTERVSGQQQILNEWCPVMTDEKADPAFTITYQGKEIRFCCDRCIAKFRANPNKYLDRLPQFAAAEPASASGGQLADSGAGEHDDNGAAEDTDRIPWLGRVHPVIVHFPLAGVPLAFLGFVVWIVTGREAFAKADTLPLLVATVFAIAAVITGNIAHDAMSFSAAMHPIVERHEFISTTVMVVTICLSALRIWRWDTLTGSSRWIYGAGLGMASGLLAFTGYLGGSLVFGPEHLSW